MRKFPTFRRTNHSSLLFSSRLAVTDAQRRRCSITSGLGRRCRKAPGATRAEGVEQLSVLGGRFSGLQRERVGGDGVPGADAQRLRRAAMRGERIDRSARAFAMRLCRRCCHRQAAGQHGSGHCWSSWGWAPEGGTQGRLWSAARQPPQKKALDAAVEQRTLLACQQPGKEWKQVCGAPQ